MYVSLQIPGSVILHWKRIIFSIRKKDSNKMEKHIYAKGGHFRTDDLNFVISTLKFF